MQRQASTHCPTHTGSHMQRQASTKLPYTHRFTHAEAGQYKTALHTQVHTCRGRPVQNCPTHTGSHKQRHASTHCPTHTGSHMQRQASTHCPTHTGSHMQRQASTHCPTHTGSHMQRQARAHTLALHTENLVRGAHRRSPKCRRQTCICIYRISSIKRRPRLNAALE